MGADPDAQLVLLRFSGDISLKARATRHQFVRRLLHNLRDALASQGLEPRVRLSHNRIFVEVPAGSEVDALARVFGIQSVSRVRRTTPADIDAIVAAGAELFRDDVRGQRFAVRAKRVGDRSRIPVASKDVERALGAALLPEAAGVDLSSPEVTVGVELMDGEAHLLPDRIRGPGGLPLGVEGRAVALLSGGFDSAVASWQLLRRGVSLDYAFCNLGGDTHRIGALRVAKVLSDRWSYGDRPKFYAIDFEPVVAQLKSRTVRRYWQILLKRLMLRAAAQLARERRAAAIVTGEAVGQVSSQTLQNLSVISRATDVMVLRPLVGTNKEEIIGLAQQIGTFELSKVVGEYCDLVPRRPATGAELEVVEAQERALDLDILARAVAERTVFDLRAIDTEALEVPELEVERVPDDSVVIDLRSEREYRSWHHPDALRLDFPHALQAYPSFDKGKTYVLYCDYGLMSAHLAEFMRKDGFEAFHFKGGTKALRRLSS